MASSDSARKRIRQNAKARSRNRWRLRTLKDSLSAFEDKLVHGKYDEAAEAFKKASAVLDRSAQKGVIHRNTASRKKSRLSVRLKTKHKSA